MTAAGQPDGAPRGGTLLERETAEQPEVAARLLEAQWPRLDDLRSALGFHAEESAVDGLVLVARGSSDNAARYAQYLWGLHVGLPVALATPSLSTVYGAELDLRRRAVVAISQSGTSPDVVSVVEAGRACGAPTLAVTNDPGSPLASAAGAVLELGAGEERSVAATKTYTASLLAVALLAVALGERSRRKERRADLDAVPGALAAAVESTRGVDEAAETLSGTDRAVSVGRGLNLSTAFETALKITELSGVLVAPYSPADLLHGPVGAVAPDVPAILVAPDEPASASVLEIAPGLAERGAPLIVVADAASALPGVPSTPIVLPATARVASWLTPLTAAVPGQLLGRGLAERRGVDVDAPGGLSKVTRTT